MSAEGITREEALRIERERKAMAGASYTRRLTARNNALLARGRHPATSLPLRGDEQCGTCVHAKGHTRTKTYYKCDQVALTFGAATDIRLSWPACTRWEPRP